MPTPKQGKLRRLLGLRTFLLINLVILFLVTLSFGREFVRNYEIDREINQLEQRALSLEQQNQDILQLAERLKTDDYLEQEGRLRLGLMKPGESVAIISEPEAGEAGEALSEPEDESSAAALSNPRLWWRYFFGI